MNRYIIWIMIFLGVVTLQGCIVSNGPKRLQLQPLPDRLTTAPEIRDLKITADLLYLVGDQRISAMVDEALDNNQDLAATALRLKAAGLLLSGTEAAMLPKLDAGYTGTRNNRSLDRQVQGSHRVGLNLSWEMDLWGRLADLHDARKEAFQGQQLGFLRAMDSLAARVLQTCFIAKSRQMALAVQEKRVALYEKIGQTILTRYRAGIGTLDEMAAARAKTRVARSDLAQAGQELHASLRDLEVLMGRYPKAALDLPDRLPDVALPAPRAPAAILANRPDVLAAAKAYESAVKEAGAGHKARLPAITLTADIFRDNARLGRLTSPPTTWEAVGSLLMPVFNAGRLRDEARAADTLARAAFKDYAQTVLLAMKEAETTFYRETVLKERLIHLTLARKEAEKNRQYYEGRFREGLSDIQALHTALDQELDIMAGLIDVKAQRVVNRIDMALSLGTCVMERKEK